MTNPNAAELTRWLLKHLRALKSHSIRVIGGLIIAHRITNSAIILRTSAPGGIKRVGIRALPVTLELCAKNVT